MWFIGKHPNHVTFSEKEKVRKNKLELYQTFTQVKPSNQLTSEISGCLGHFSWSYAAKYTKTLPKSSKSSLKKVGWFSPFWKLGMPMMLVCMYGLFMLEYHCRSKNKKNSKCNSKYNSNCTKFTIKNLREDLSNLTLDSLSWSYLVLVI